ncbi:MAG: RNA pseudouridine synthase, partial [Rhodospirillales bacterium]|nr:RNA pseudouridine synthase [Rhodospirillales bacterium]
GIGGVLRPGIVHRLDKDTSGLIIAAKTDIAHRSLTGQFAARTVERVYAALVWGRPRTPTGEISGAIGRSRGDRKKMTVVARGGKAALTRYTVIADFAGGAISLLECRLATGRTHQIRVHLAAAGHPLVGDPLYGRPSHRRKALPPVAAAAVAAFNRQALDAFVLAFIHPTSGKRLSFMKKYSNDIKLLISKLENI